MSFFEKKFGKSKNLKIPGSILKPPKSFMYKILVQDLYKFYQFCEYFTGNIALVGCQGKSLFSNLFTNPDASCFFSGLLFATSFSFSSYFLINWTFWFFCFCWNAILRPGQFALNYIKLHKLSLAFWEMFFWLMRHPCVHLLNTISRVNECNVTNSCVCGIEKSAIMKRNSQKEMKWSIKRGEMQFLSLCVNFCGVMISLIYLKKKLSENIGIISMNSSQQSNLEWVIRQCIDRFFFSFSFSSHLILICF
jgi:hypothetical protein